MEGKIYHYMFFLPGDNTRDSCHKFYEWLDVVYIETGLPCTSKVKGVKRINPVKGCYHHLTGEQRYNLMRVLQVKLLPWAAVCLQNNKSCGSVLLATSSGKGEMSMMAQVIGPMIHNTTVP